MLFSLRINFFYQLIKSQIKYVDWCVGKKLKIITFKIFPILFRFNLKTLDAFFFFISRIRQHYKFFLERKYIILVVLFISVRICMFEFFSIQWIKTRNSKHDINLHLGERYTIKIFSLTWFMIGGLSIEYFC